MDERWSAERWSDPAPQRSTPRPAQRPEQGIDRLVNAGRQLVDGVSGARPGSRRASRGTGAGAGVRPRLGELGRWVEDKLEWILEDDDDWREPWQEPREPPAQRPAARRAQPQAQPQEQRQPISVRSSSRRRPLEAISRRGPLIQPAAEDGWPDDDSFSLPRWQRSPAPSMGQPTPVRQPPPPSTTPPRSIAPESAGSRPLPRSSRRRQPD